MLELHQGCVGIRIQRQRLLRGPEQGWEDEHPDDLVGGQQLLAEEGGVEEHAAPRAPRERADYVRPLRRGRMHRVPIREVANGLSTLNGALGLDDAVANTRVVLIEAESAARPNLRGALEDCALCKDPRWNPIEEPGVHALIVTIAIDRLLRDGGRNDFAPTEPRVRQQPVERLAGDVYLRVWIAVDPQVPHDREGCDAVLLDEPLTDAKQDLLARPAKPDDDRGYRLILFRARVVGSVSHVRLLLLQRQP